MVVEHGSCRAIERDGGDEREWSGLLAKLQEAIVKRVHVDDVRGERLDDEPFGGVEETRSLRGDRQHARRRGQWRHERQRKVAADAVDARHHQAGYRRGTADARRAGEAPGRTCQVDVEPAIAERGLARGHACLQPPGPYAAEGGGGATAEKIAVAGQLSVESDVHARRCLAAGHSLQRNCRSTSLSWKGLRIVAASRRTFASCPSFANVTSDRTSVSGDRCALSSSRNHA